MATYVAMMKFTEQGIRNIKESPTRIENARRMIQSAGGELKQWWLAMGRYDAFIVCDAPNDEAVAKVILTLGALGNVRTETFRVFSEADFRKMVGSLP
jgi:uncharacterized protein with GYD domain